MKVDPVSLFREADGVPAPDLWEDARRRTPRQPLPESSGRRAGIVGLAFAVAIAGLGFAGSIYVRVSREPAPGQGPTPSEHPATPTPKGPIRPHLAGIIPIADPQDSIAGEIAAGEGAIWIGTWSQRDDQPDSIIRIDPVTNDIVATIPLDGPPLGITTGYGSVWVDVLSSGGAQEHLDRIDPATNAVVASIPIGYGRGGLRAAIAVGLDDVWAWSSLEDGSRVLFRIDPSSNAVIGTVPLGPGPDWGHFGDGQVVIADGVVWVLDWNGDLLRVDPTQAAVVATIPVGGSHMALGNGTLWLRVLPSGVEPGVDQTSQVQRVDPSSGELIGEPFSVQGGKPSNLDGSSSPLAVDGDNLWVNGYSGDQALITIARVNLDTMQVVDSILIPIAQSPGIVFDGASQTVWVDGTFSIYRVDLRDPEPTLTEPGSDQCPAQPEKGFQPVSTPASAPAGSTVTISGNVPHYHKDGSYGPGAILQWWWNVEPSDNGWAYLTPGSGKEPPSASPGSILLLGEANPQWACTYELELRIPDVQPGTYSIVSLQSGFGGAALLSTPITLEVTAA